MNYPHTSDIRVFFDADVIFAGSASPRDYGASLVLLRMAEITLIQAVTSRQVIDEVERNLREKIPSGIPAFQMIVNRCLTVVDNPGRAEITKFTGCADEKDLPILVAAQREKCSLFTTYNIRHYHPGIPGITVLTPGDLVLKVRYRLNGLSSK
jgi:predicted nucleic acid-binding protein